MLVYGYCFSQDHIDAYKKQIAEFKLNYNFHEVEKNIKAIQKQFPKNTQAQNLIADWFYFVMDYKKSDSLYAGILDKDSTHISSLNGRAMIAFDNGDMENSLKFIQKALEIDSTNIISWINYSKILLEKRDREGYFDAINKALKIDSLNSDALAGKGFYYATLRYNIKEGAKYFNKSIEINPLNKKAHHYLGRGYSPYNYHLDKPLTGKTLIIVDSLLRVNQFESAYTLISKQYAKDSNDLNVLKLNAACEFHLGNYRKTIKSAFKMLELRPNYGLAHYFIAESLNKLEDEHNILMRKFKDTYEKRQVPGEIPFLEDVFINYHQCDSNLKKIIRINTYPFSGFMEALALSGATVYFMDFHHLMFECPYLKNRKGTRVVDFRLADDIKGQGGYHMTSNKLQQSEEIYGKFNVAFHEFGHLVQWLFTYEQNAELMHLYTKAKMEKRTLDWYADLNIQEYFAQGIEAYLSERKLPGQSDATNNTKKELFERDIDLFKFIDSLVSQQSYQKHLIQAYIVKSWYTDSLENALSLLKNALLKYPNNPELLIEVGIVYREKSDFQKAEEYHRQVIGFYPNNLQAHLELTYDIFLQGTNIEESIRMLEDLKNQPKFNSKMYRFLGYYYANMTEYDKAIENLEIAKSLEPYPDPYDISLPDVYFLLSKAQIKIKDFLSAEENLHKSLNINRSNAETYAELAFINYQSDNLETANRFIMTAIQLDPANNRVVEVEKLLKLK